MVVVSAAVEAEVAELPVEERAGFLSGLGLKESGLQQVIHEGYDLLHLLTFLLRDPKKSCMDGAKSATAPEAAVSFIPILKKDLFGRK